MVAIKMVLAETVVIEITASQYGRFSKRLLLEIPFLSRLYIYRPLLEIPFLNHIYIYRSLLEIPFLNRLYIYRPLFEISVL